MYLLLLSRTHYGCSDYPYYPCRPMHVSCLTKHGSTSSYPRKLRQTTKDSKDALLSYMWGYPTYTCIRGVHAYQPAYMTHACLSRVCLTGRSWRIHARFTPGRTLTSFRASLGRVGYPGTRFCVRVWHKAKE